MYGSETKAVGGFISFTMFHSNKVHIKGSWKTLPIFRMARQLYLLSHTDITKHTTFSPHWKRSRGLRLAFLISWREARQRGELPAGFLWFISEPDRSACARPPPAAPGDTANTQRGDKNPPARAQSGPRLGEGGRGVGSWRCKLIGNKKCGGGRY